MRTTHNIVSILLMLLATVTWLSTAVAAQERASEAREEPTSLGKLRAEVSRRFSARISLLGFGIATQPVDSGLNPNNILHIPRYQLELDLRPDLALNFRQLELSVKPRFELRWRQWEDGIPQGDSTTDVPVFVQEWLARYSLTNPLFVF